MIESFEDGLLRSRHAFTRAPKSRSRAKRSSVLQRNSIPSPTISTRGLPSETPLKGLAAPQADIRRQWRDAIGRRGALIRAATPFSVSASTTCGGLPPCAPAMWFTSKARWSSLRRQNKAGGNRAG